MEYQKIINLLDKTLNQATKFRANDCVEINDYSLQAYNNARQIKFETSIVRSSLCDYSDAYIVAKIILLVRNTAREKDDADNGDKKVTFKKCVPFIDSINKINNTQIDNAKGIDNVNNNNKGNIVIIIGHHLQVFGNTGVNDF